MTNSATALIAGCEPTLAGRLAALLQECGVGSASTSSVAGAMAAMAAEEISVVFCGADLEGGSYRNLVRGSNLRKGKTPIVVLFRLGEWEEYLDAVRQGAFDCLAPPYRHSEIARILGAALEDKQRRPVAAEAGPQ